MARYANENVTSIESVVGKFNIVLENKKLLALNELQSIDMNKYLNNDALKSGITDKKTNINQKNEPERFYENVINLMIEFVKFRRPSINKEKFLLKKSFSVPSLFISNGNLNETEDASPVKVLLLSWRFILSCLFEIYS